MAEPEEKSLKRADGDIAPQGYDEAKEEFDFIQLRDGRQLVRDDKVEKKLDELIDATGETEVKFPDDFPDEDVKSELESMKETQKDMMDAIKNTNETLENVVKDGSVNTQLTGSNVDEIYLQAEDEDDDEIEIKSGESKRLLSHKIIDMSYVNYLIFGFEGEDIEVAYYNTVYKSAGNMFKIFLDKDDIIGNQVSDRFLFKEEVYLERITVELRNKSDDDQMIRDAFVLSSMK